MKRIYKFLILAVVASSTMFYSCETLELENLASPNALAPDQADPNLLFNNIQLSYRNAMATFNNRGAELGRIDNMFGRNYFNNYGPNTLNGPWNNLYSSIIPDISNLETLNTPDAPLDFQIGAAKTMQAHLMMLLVDFLGDVIYSQANNPGEFPSPSVDDDADVYNAALSVLDDAYASLQTATGNGGALDLYFGGSLDKWRRLNRTVKMRADLTLGNNTAVINATNVMQDGGDMAFSYGTNELNPDTRHPDYNGDYRSDGANTYMSTWLMSLMVGQYGDFTPLIGGPQPDPRRRYYWYRQNWRTPGSYALFRDVNGLLGPAGTTYLSTGAGNGETLQCSLQSTPTHLQFTPDELTWCSTQMGYWGRAHGNDEGTPPDNFTRTASGVYPAGGKFDGAPDVFPYVGVFPNLGQQVALGAGGGGAGIEPIITAASVDFWRAEAYLDSGNPGMAATYLQSGITKSIAKVMSFGSLDAGANMANAPTSTMVSTFIAEKVAAFNAAPTTPTLDGFGFPVAKSKWDILGEQFLVALYGGGADAFNFIRRTGYPTTMQRSLEEVPGPFPRTMLYPTNETIANPNIVQRNNLTTLVFWDSGVTNPAN
jgi:hypothetical protein